MMIHERVAKEVYEAVDVAVAEVRELADKLTSMGDADGLFDDYLETLAADIQAIADRLETMCDEDGVASDLEDIASLDQVG